MFADLLLQAEWPSLLFLFTLVYDTLNVCHNCGKAKNNFAVRMSVGKKVGGSSGRLTCPEENDRIYSVERVPYSGAGPVLLESAGMNEKTSCAVMKEGYNELF